MSSFPLLLKTCFITLRFSLEWKPSLKEGNTLEAIGNKVFIGSQIKLEIGILSIAESPIMLSYGDKLFPSGSALYVIQLIIIARDKANNKMSANSACLHVMNALKYSPLMCVIKSKHHCTFKSAKFNFLFHF